MKKYLFLGSLIVLAFIFIFIELQKDETFRIVENDKDTFILIESHKRLNPSYKRALLNIEDIQIVNASGDDIDIGELKIGATIKAEFDSLALFSDPPVLSASKVVLLK